MPKDNQIDLWGALAIAKFLFGRDGASERRRIYHLLEITDKPKPPIFQIGATLCARSEALVRWIEDQEKEAAQVKSGV